MPQVEIVELTGGPSRRFTVPAIPRKGEDVVLDLDGSGQKHEYHVHAVSWFEETEGDSLDPRRLGALVVLSRKP